MWEGARTVWGWGRVGTRGKRCGGGGGRGGAARWKGSGGMRRGKKRGRGGGRLRRRGDIQNNKVPFGCLSRRLDTEGRRGRNVAAGRGEMSNAFAWWSRGGGGGGGKKSLYPFSKLLLKAGQGRRWERRGFFSFPPFGTGSPPPPRAFRSHTHLTFFLKVKGNTLLRRGFVSDLTCDFRLYGSEGEGGRKGRGGRCMGLFSQCGTALCIALFSVLSKPGCDPELAR